MIHGLLAHGCPEHSVREFTVRETGRFGHGRRKTFPQGTHLSPLCVGLVRPASKAP
jgi:hypothetical protein